MTNLMHEQLNFSTGSPVKLPLFIHQILSKNPAIVESLYL